MNRTAANRRTAAIRPTLLARAAAAGLLACMATSAAHAAPVPPSVPWMPDTSSRHALQLLVDEGGLDLPVMQWPLPAGAVAQALDRLPADLPGPLDAARARVRAALGRLASPQFTLNAREHADGLAGFGDDATPGSSVALRSGELDGPHFAAQLGARLAPEGDPSHAGAAGSLEGSAIATEAFGLQLQAWSHRSWWSPGWQSALPLSNNAPALNGIGLQRASASTSASPWLSWLGPWNMDFWVARSESEREQPANPLVSGTRLTIRPFSHLELGFTRMAQWGGAGRSESAKTFAKIMFGIHTNEGTDELRKRDPGNELAGYDVRLRCPFGWRCAGYGQWIGEDGAGFLPSKFLNLAGAEFWSADGTQRVFIETADTHLRQTWPGPAVWGQAYRNYAYPGGFTSGNRWLGANVGPDSRLLTLGWIDAASDSSLRLSAGHVGSRLGAFAPPVPFAPTSGRIIGLAARTSFAWGPATLSPQLDWLRLHSPRGINADARIGLEMNLGLDKLSRTVPTRLGDALSGTSSPAVQGTTAAAIVVASVLLDHAADRYALNRRHDPTSKALQVVGSDLPYAELGLAGAAWLSQRGTPLGDTALASVKAGLTSVGLSEVLKQAVDRSRPSDGRGAGDFGNARRSDSAFPSTHSALAWGVVTPFAQEYDAPWLYGVAALTNLSRVLRRDHWFSDTVAGAAIGYVAGDWFHRHMRAGPDATQAQLVVAPHQVGMTMDFR